jgi:hypothetical protein
MLQVTVGPPTIGPPNYLGSSQNQNAIVQDAAVSMGGSTGTGTCVTPTDFHNPECRATDSLSGGGYNWSLTGIFTGNYTVTPTGGDYTSIWSCGGLCGSPNLAFIIATFSGCCYGVLGINTTNPAAPIAASALVPGFQVGGEAFAWDKHTNGLLVHMVTGTGALESYTFTNATTAPTANGTFFDFKNCTGSGVTASNVTWQGDMGISADNDFIGVSASISGSQDTGTLILAYQRSTGSCWVYHTDTATITCVGSGCVSGSTSISDTYHVHDSNMSASHWIQISASNGGLISVGCHSLSNTNQNYFWNIATATVTCMDSSTAGTGHNVAGSLKEWNTDNYPTSEIRTFATPGTYALWGGTYPSPCCSQVTNAHQSWPSPDTGMVFTTTTSVGLGLGASPTFTSPLVDEIYGQTMDGTNTWRRFHHCHITDTNANFYVSSCIDSVSQDGRFVVWTSDNLGNFGGRIDLIVGALQ